MRSDQRSNLSSFSHVWALATVCALILAGCSAGSVRARVPPDIDHSTPESLLLELQAAALAGDYSIMLECMEPPFQKSFDAVLAASKVYTDSLDSAAAVIEEYVGEKEAREFCRRVYSGVLLPPLGGAAKDGNLDRSKVRISISGDEATADIVDPRALSKILMVRIKGRWYLRGTYLGCMGPRVDDERTRTAVRLFRGGARDCEERTAQIRKGVIGGAEVRALIKELSPGPEHAPSE